MRARLLEVLVELGLVRPGAVFHVQHGVVFAAVGRHCGEIDLANGRPLDGKQQLALHLVAHSVDVGGPAAQVAGLDAAGESFVRGAVGERGDRRVVVRATGAVRELQVVKQAGVVVARQRAHPAFAERIFELVLVPTGDRVDLVQ